MYARRSPARVAKLADARDLKVLQGHSFIRANFGTCGRGGIGRRNGLKGKLECSPGNWRCRTAQIRGTLSNGDPEPSLDRDSSVEEGVETRRAAPKPSTDMVKG